MSQHFVDQLLERSRAKGGPVCVGLDPVYERLPAAVIAAHHGDHLAAIERFCIGILDAVAEQVPCVKPQSACFERYGAPGVAVYERIIALAHARDLLVIADVKRGDIGASAAHYAAGLLGTSSAGAATANDTPDAITINAYLGQDSLTPFIETARDHHKGLFALVRTSNPGGDAIQSLPLTDGRTVGEAVADVIAQAGSDDSLIGEAGYSLLGAVVGATKPRDIASLRQRMPQQLWLVPGFGAQGGSAEDVRACFKPDGTGAIITASRSVIYAFSPNAGDHWQSEVAAAALNFKQQVASVLRT